MAPRMLVKKLAFRSPDGSYLLVGSCKDLQGRGLRVLLTLLACLLASPPAMSEPSDEARAAKARGDRLSEAGDFDAAVSAYRQALELEPEYALACNELGTALFRLGRREQALEKFERAVELDDEYAVAWFNLAFVSRAEERWETSARAYQRYTELVPEEPDAWYGLGLSLVALERWDEAARALDGYADRETRAARQDRARQARDKAAELRRRVTEEPSQPSTTTVRQTTVGEEPPSPRMPSGPRTPSDPSKEQGLGRPGSHVQQGLGSMGSPADAISFGDARLEDGEAGMAVEAYERALSIEPMNVEAVYKRAFAHARLGEYRQAILGWERVLELEPQNQGARRNIDMVRSKMAGEESGSKRATRSPDRAVDREAARRAYGVGVRLIGERRFDEAVEAFQKALEHDPTLVQARVAMGSAFSGSGRFEEARTAFERALRERPGMAAPLFGLAEVHRAEGRTDRARHYYASYLESDARDVDPALKEQARKWLERL